MAIANEAKIEKAQEMRHQGMTFKEISEELGVSIITVRRYIRMDPDYDGPPVAMNVQWTIEAQEEFMWKWPVAINLIRRAYGMDPLPVPKHNRDAEREWLAAGRKNRRSRRTL